MSIWDWFKPPALRAMEVEARARRLLVQRQLGGLTHAIYGDENALPPRRSDQVVGMGEVPRSTDEALSYAIALDWVNRRGANEASRLADLTVRNVQMLSRGL